MPSDTFQALMLTRDDSGGTRAEIRQLSDSDLPDGDVLVAVDYSSLNYKDALAITGKGKIVRNWPMVPGIDLAGSVLESSSSEYATGDQVLLTGWGVGEQHWGGYSQRQRVQSKWLAPMPAGLDGRTAMAIGTAGFTAMLCVMTLEEAGITPESGTILVSGATGGVGSVAIALLAGLGCAVTAVTGRPETEGYLRSLGASAVVSREEMNRPARPLEGQRWAAAIDTVGGALLARVLAETRYGGCVAACGLAGGFDLPTTVMPFILRGVSLRGVDSVLCPPERRLQAWQRLATDLPATALDDIADTIRLEELPDAAAKLLAGQLRGRVIVDLRR